jgi:drug/metabolite transporter (DMT)-like permease
VLNAIILKRGETGAHDRLVVMASNYLVAAALAVGLWLVRGAQGFSWPTLALGLVGGIFYAGGMIMWMVAIRRSGIGTSTAALRMGVVWPVLVSMVFFSEVPSLYQSLGIALALVAILLVSLSGRLGDASTEGSAVLLLLATWVIAGACFVTLKVFTEVSPKSEKDALLALIFGSAFIISWGWVILRKRRFRRGDFASGSVFGFFNVTSNMLVLTGLQTVPGILAFPILNTGILFATGLLGVAVYGERPGLWGVLALPAAAGAIALMSL